MSSSSEHRHAPASLARLLKHVEDQRASDHAWTEFVDDHNRLLLSVAAGFSKSYDERMDYYTHLLSELQKDNYRRLQAYTATTDAKFTTWLVVVARRLCLDHQRQHYGRSTDNSGMRRSLADFGYEELDPERISDTDGKGPERTVRERQLHTILGEAVSRLATSDQILLTLRFRDGYSAREIARALKDGSQWSVYRRINAILVQLKQALEDRGIDGPDA